MADNFDDEEFIDETLAERLWGLTEMFPECVRNAASKSTELSKWATVKLYRFARYSLWVGTSSFMILAIPVVFEQERYNLQQQQEAHQRQLLLGPSAAAVAGTS